MTTIRTIFFTNQGTFFQFSEKGRGYLPPQPILPHPSSSYGPERAVRKQIIVFISKIFKTTKVQGKKFLAEVDVASKKRYLVEAVTQRCCKNSILKNLGKLTGKYLCSSLCLACGHERLLKKRLPHRCFLITFIRRVAFSQSACELLTIIFNFIENT